MPWRSASVFTMIWRRASQAFTRGWSFQRNTSSSTAQRFGGGAAHVCRQVLFGIHGGKGDAAANADLIGRSAHLVGEGSAGFEEAGGAGADHGSVSGEAAGVDVFRREAAFEGDEIALPHGVA